MTSLLQKERIQNALVDLGKAGPYYAVSFDPDTGHATADESVSVAPTSAYADEVSASFQPAHNRIEKPQLDWRNWMFALDLQFSERVTIEPFANKLSQTPPVLAGDFPAGQRQVTLILNSFDKLVHPPQQQPQTGTKARLLIEARLSPK